MLELKSGHVSNDGKRTRVDGKGLWRSWKRNFKTKLLALLDLIDNSLDAAIQKENDNDANKSFVGRVHIFPDVHEILNGPDRAFSTTTGLCIINNCIKKIRPLQKVLEVYNSSKLNSGARSIGENGVGLKQGCATLSDRSFVLIKNGSDANIELGICAESLQREEGCYLPAFKFSNKKGEGSLSLKDQMTLLFSQPNHADVALCIAQYGAGSFESDPSLEIGVERLCCHFDHICSNFFDNSFVFMIVLDKVHHGQSEEYVQNAWDAQQKITVNNLLKELGAEIPRTYLHIPDTFDFMIGDKKAEFKFWPARLVELTAFKVNISPKTPWQKQKLDIASDHPDSYELPLFVGFDGLRVTEAGAGKEGSLYVYSRQSGRLISDHPDARTLLGLSAGGTAFCQGLTIIIDDIGGNLPLSPTKQEVAFGEESHGAIHEENLLAWVGSVAHFFYQFHLEKFHQRKTQLTRQIAKFGDLLLQKHRPLKTLDSSKLTTFHLSFKSTGRSIRVDKSSAQETVGIDTRFQLHARKSCPSGSSITDATGRKRKNAINDVCPPNSSKIPRRRQPVSYKDAESGTESESDLENKKASDDNAYQTAKSASNSSHPLKQPSPNPRNASSDASSESEEGEIKEDPPTQCSVMPSAHEGCAKHEETASLDVYRDLCVKLTTKTNAQKGQIKSLKVELSKEKNLRQIMQQQIKTLQRKIHLLES